MLEDGLYIKKKQNKQHVIVEANWPGEQLEDIYIKQIKKILIIINEDRYP
mgnify:FL=1|tara:strand:- start:2258 stop:2407 length:150 start_codon:yes stop_codon:yes gene_type:complete